MGRDWNRKEVPAYRDHNKNLVFYCGYCLEWHTAGSESDFYTSSEVGCEWGTWFLYWNGQKFSQKARRSPYAIAHYVEPEDGMVYFIRAGTKGPIKIGITSLNGYDKRLATLQGAHYLKLSLVGYMFGGKEEEVRLHKRFSDIRLRGEWFKSRVDLTKYIALNTIRPDQILL